MNDAWERLIVERDKILKKAPNGKKALVIRLGGFGDLIMITPLLKQLKKDDYYIVFNGQGIAMQVLVLNPNIDARIKQERNEIDPKELDVFWKELGEGFDSVINLSGTIEGHLLKPEGSGEFNWSKEKRHAECNLNYIDYTMECGGYPELKGLMPELHFSVNEHKWAKQFRNAHKDKFIVLWSLAGSGFHKIYPYTEYVSCEFLDKHKDTVVLTVGEDICKILEWNHPRTKCL